MNTSYLKSRLSVMMFLQFFIWGSWYLSVSLYMAAHGMGDMRYYAYTAGPLAAIITPICIGLIADRFINTEKVLGILFLLGGFFMFLLCYIGGMGDPEGFKLGSQTIEIFGNSMSKGNVFNMIILAHMLCYMPTLGLTASLSFNHLSAEKFPLIRLWGTIGWIVAGFILAFVFIDTDTAGTTIDAATKSIQFILAGSASILLGLYCFSLPKTPPPKKGEKITFSEVLFKDAWMQFKNPSFAIFMFCSFLLCIPLAAYYASLQQQMQAMGITHITAWKNVGTFLEAGMMFLMPLFFRKLGVKKMILIGVGAWVLRYILFALGANGTQAGFIMVVAGIGLHGFCYDFFFVTGQVYVDNSTSSNIRGQVQSMNIFFTQGIGMLIGALVVNNLAGKVFAEVGGKSWLPEALPYWSNLWYPLAIMAAVILVIFALAFHPKDKKEEETKEA